MLNQIFDIVNRGIVVLDKELKLRILNYYIVSVLLPESQRKAERIAPSITLLNV
ncbi:MAG: hypothetical protein SCALA701_12960 [Candidatus Scalindua sp.]|nr:hypothetical protein [Planctomycetota bacterium]GJQ58495.1 MAG: hypothetical protein SCALA701_12960 [Candidatus Scalindua sp.]